MARCDGASKFEIRIGDDASLVVMIDEGMVDELGETAHQIYGR